MEKSLTRSFDGIAETYESETLGHCKCGQLITRVNGSDRFLFVDGKLRYYYPEDAKRLYSIFRCQKCHEPIDDNFIKRTEDGGR